MSIVRLAAGVAVYWAATRVRIVGQPGNQETVARYVGWKLAESIGDNGNQYGDTIGTVLAAGAGVAAYKLLK